MPIPEPPPSARVRHYQGERLSAGDLQDEYDNAKWLRGLHVLALHDTWGIALGFDVRLGPNNSVIVGPGLAYDVCGREIVLARPRTVPSPWATLAKPQQTGSYDLVISYNDALGLREAGRAWLPCEGEDNCPGREQPLFAWRVPDAVRLGLEVPLLRLTPAADSNQITLDRSVRRYTQSQARPHIVSGVTPPEQAWSLWSNSGGRQGQILGFQTWVDTSAAGFVGRPVYLASLRAGTAALSFGDAAFLSTISGGGVTDPAPDIVPMPGVAFTNLANRLPWGFTFRVTFGFNLKQIRSSGDTEARALAFLKLIPRRISWIGVEQVDGCAPVVDWDFWIDLVTRRSHLRSGATVGHL